MKRFVQYIFMIIAIAVLAGCQVEAKEPYTYHDPYEAPFLVSENPQGLKEGVVSEEYFNQIRLFYSQTSMYMTSQLLFRLDAQTEDNIFENDTYKENFTELLDKGTTILEGYSHSPQTEAEVEIHNAIKLWIKASKEANELLRDVLYREDESLIYTHYEILGLENQRAEDVYTILEKYNLK